MNRIQRFINETNNPKIYDDGVRRFLYFCIIRRQMTILPVPFLADTRVVFAIPGGFVYLRHAVLYGGSAGVISPKHMPELTPLPGFWLRYKKEGIAYLEVMSNVRS